MVLKLYAFIFYHKWAYLSGRYKGLNLVVFMDIESYFHNIHSAQTQDLLTRIRITVKSRNVKPDKSELFHITRKHKIQDFELPRLNEAELSTSENVTYLGLIHYRCWIFTQPSGFWTLLEFTKRKYHLTIQGYYKTLQNRQSYKDVHYISSKGSLSYHIISG